MRTCGCGRAWTRTAASGMENTQININAGNFRNAQDFSEKYAMEHQSHRAFVTNGNLKQDQQQEQEQPPFLDQKASRLSPVLCIHVVN